MMSHSNLRAGPTLMGLLLWYAFRLIPLLAVVGIYFSQSVLWDTVFVVSGMVSAYWIGVLSRQEL
jgi:hypothetical protein